MYIMPRNKLIIVYISLTLCIILIANSTFLLFLHFDSIFFLMFSKFICLVNYTCWHIKLLSHVHTFYYHCTTFNSYFLQCRQIHELLCIYLTLWALTLLFLSLPIYIIMASGPGFDRVSLRLSWLKGTITNGPMKVTSDIAGSNSFSSLVIWA